MNGKGWIWGFLGVVILVLGGVFFLSHFTESEKAKEVHAGISYAEGKILPAQPEPTFKAMLADGEFSRRSGSFKIGADYGAFLAAERLWAKERTAPVGDPARDEAESFYLQVQDQLKGDLLANQFTAATLGEIVGEPGLWGKLNHDPR